MKYFPENTLVHYTTKLPQAIELSGGLWEVGLVELMYPHTWYNITGETRWIVLSTSLATNVKMQLKPGYYGTSKSLIQGISGVKELVPGHSEISLTFDATTQKVMVVI